MISLRTATGWILGIAILLAAFLLFLMGARAQSLLLLAIVMLAVPPGRAGIRRILGRSMPWWATVGGIVVLGALFVLVGRLTRPTSIYKSTKVRERFLEIYDEKMNDWPVPYDSVFVDTAYGRAHVIVSGPEDATPVVLLHASVVSSWSWKYNARELSARHRVFAIDLIGDVGRSQLASMDNRLESGLDQAELYAEITKKLGVERACVVGASEGGFIGTNYALHEPGRVAGLVLLGPMGYTGATKSALRIMLAQMFPFKSVQDSTFRWAFSDNAALEQEFEEWFRLAMTGYNPAKVMPLPFSAEQRRSIGVPVLLVLGKRDNLVGDPDAARRLVRDIPDIRVEVLDAGHLIAGERPKETNALILEFCESIYSKRRY
jgi:pimeloyl-ACP methyl ester carboxylesterase